MAISRHPDSLDPTLQSQTVGLSKRRELAVHRWPLIPIAIAAAVGVVADRSLHLGSIWFGITPVLGLLWIWLHRRNSSYLSAFALLLTVAACSAGWHHQQWRWFAADDLGRFATLQGAPVCLEVQVLDAPQRRPEPQRSPLRAIPQSESTLLLVKIERLRDGELWRTASGQSELIVDGELGDHIENLAPGDRLRVFAQMRSPSPAMNPGQFDYAQDARADRHLAMLRTESPACLTLLESGSWSVGRMLARMRQSITNRLLLEVGPQRGALAAAMLVGAREGVTREVSDAFRRTGSLHVLVVSGLHVGIVISLFYVASRMGWFPRRRTLLLIMVLILGYTLLTGARPPVVRAAVLAEVLCLAAIMGRPLLAINSLALAAIIVLAINPSELFRSGTQLSFLAAATLIWFGRWQSLQGNIDPMERLLRSVESIPRRFGRSLSAWAGTILLATTAVWLVATPLLLWQFHLLSPVALPVSLAVFPLVTVSLIASLALVTIGTLIPPLSSPLSTCCSWAISGLEHSIALADTVPGGSFYSAGPAGWWCVGTYLILLVGFLGGARPAIGVRLTKLGIAWIATGFLVAMITNQRPEGLRCSYIAVGHGLSVLIETPQGQAILYDAGSLGSPEAAAETVSGVLWSRGISHLDAVVLSHTDVDHYNAVPELSERFSIGGVYTTHAMLPQGKRMPPGSAVGILARSLQRSGVPITRLAQGDRLRFGATVLDVLHPTEEGTGGSDNSNSLVLGIEYGDRRVLLPGDLESPGLEDLMFQSPYDCDLLLAPHHGSARSDPPGFAAWSNPEWVVISSGTSSDTSSAGKSYTESGAEVLRTASEGMITFVLSSEEAYGSSYLDQLHRPLGSK